MERHGAEEGVGQVERATYGSRRTSLSRSRAGWCRRLSRAARQRNLARLPSITQPSFDTAAYKASSFASESNLPGPGLASSWRTHFRLVRACETKPCLWPASHPAAQERGRKKNGKREAIPCSLAGGFRGSTDLPPHPAKVLWTPAKVPPHPADLLLLDSTESALLRSHSKYPALPVIPSLPLRLDQLSRNSQPAGEGLRDEASPAVRAACLSAGIRGGKGWEDRGNTILLCRTLQ